LYWRLRKILAAQYSYHSRSLTHGQGSPGACNAHIIEHHLSGGRFGGIHAEGLIAYAGGFRSGKRSYAQHGDDYLTSKTGKERVAFALKMVEYQYLAFQKLRFKH
jgi:hypothetical protein